MRNTASMLALAGILLLSACDWGKKREDEVLPVNTMADDVVNNAAAETVPEATPVNDTAADATNIAAPPPPPPPVTVDQQTLDDADATGLTSRLPEDDAPTNMASR